MRGVMGAITGASLALVMPSIAVIAQNSEATQPPAGAPSPAPTQPRAPQAAPMAPGGRAVREADPNAGLVPGAPIGSSRQTVPAKISPENAAKDERPIMAYRLALTDAQRQRIFEAVSADNDAVVRNIEAAPATLLPPDVAMQNFPQRLTDEIPTLQGLKYVRLPEKVLLVSPPNRIVVGEISR